MVQNTNTVGRRSILSLFGAGAAALGAGMGALLSARAEAATKGFQPIRHATDDWLDAPKGGHRMVIDSSTAEGGGSALLYAANFFSANKAGYNLDPSGVAVVVVLRHFSTPFAYTDAIWAKYGAVFSEIANFKDPKSKTVPAVNLYDAEGYGVALNNFGNTISSLVEKKAQFAVCNVATRFFAGVIAGKSGGNAEAIYQELASNLVPNAHMVAAGVLGVSRAQERGYTLLYAA